MYRILIASCFALPIVAQAAQLPAVSTPPNAEELAARIDSVVKADILPRGFPSVSIVVTRGGKTLLDRTWGIANVTTGPKSRTDHDVQHRLDGQAVYRRAGPQAR